MGDEVKVIEYWVFCRCRSLQCIRLSMMTLEHIGKDVFYGCRPLEAMVSPSTVKTIEKCTFEHCESLRLLILPNNIDLGNVGFRIVCNSMTIYQIAETAGVEYEQVGAGRSGFTMRVAECRPPQILLHSNFQFFA